MSVVVRRLAPLLLAAFAVPAAAEGWTRTSDVGRDPVSKTLREAYDLDATARVEVSAIGGSVQVHAGDGNKAELVYEKRAASQKDFDCETLKVEHSKGELRIWVVHDKSRACRVVRAHDELTLTVPRGASVSVHDVGDEVSVTGVEGLIRVTDIGNSVTLTGAQQVEAMDIGNRVEVNVTKLGAAGIRVSDIGNRVDLNLPETLDARVRIADVGNEIRGPGLHLESDDDEDSYEGVLGQGGPLIRISDIGNSVVIRGPQMRRERTL